MLAVHATTVPSVQRACDQQYNFQMAAAIVEQHPLEEDDAIPIGAYNSKTIEQTLEEIRDAKIAPGRPLIRMQFIKKRKEFNQSYKFTQNDNEKNQDFKPLPADPLSHKQTKVIEIGLQGSNPYTSSGVQTIWKRRINKCIQIEDQSTYLKIDDDNADLLKFLETVYPEIEQALQSNETIDIFQNDFDVLPKDEGTKQSAEISNTIKETKNLFYLNCKGKKVSCIQFQPWITGKSQNYIVAESFVQNLPFDDRIIFSMKSSKSCILFWNFEDLHSIDPIVILSSPLEIISFEFNPKDPNVVVGGSINGQVVLWDIRNIPLTSEPVKKQQNKKTQKNEVREVSPSLLSALQDPGNITPITDQMKKNVPSHKNPILCLKWFPSGLQIDIKKSFSTLVHNSGNEVHQFATISSDGQVLLWDKRFQDSQKKQITDLSLVNWKAGYGFQLFRPEGGGTLGGSQIAFKKNQRSTIFTGTSDQGELFVCDWSVRAGDDGVTKNDPITRYWNQERSYRPTVALELCPSNEDIYLTVFDFHFSIWRADVDVPIFQSMISKGAFHTCGCWSQTRAGVLFIGKSDGTLDIWDFIDQSHKWTIQYSVTSIGVSSIKFHDQLTNVLAVGDLEGTLHILELPFTLVRKVGDEDRTMNDFWAREIERVKYFAKRFELRYEEHQKEKGKKDLEEKLQSQKEEKKDKDKGDEDELINKEYLEFSQNYLDQFIYKIEKKPEPKETPAKR